MATLTFNNISVEVKTHSEFPNSEVVSIELKNGFAGEWNIATFANEDSIEFQFLHYEDSIPFRDNFDKKKYEAAKAAVAKVKEAIASYHEEMKELGAVYCEYSNYEEFDSWLSIPDIPDYEWDTY